MFLNVSMYQIHMARIISTSTGRGGGPPEGHAAHSVSVDVRYVLAGDIKGKMYVYRLLPMAVQMRIKVFWTWPEVLSLLLSVLIAMVLVLLSLYVY